MGALTLSLFRALKHSNALCVKGSHPLAPDKRCAAVISEDLVCESNCVLCCDAGLLDLVIAAVIGAVHQLATGVDLLREIAWQAPVTIWPPVVIYFVKAPALAAARSPSCAGAASMPANCWSCRTPPREVRPRAPRRRHTAAGQQSVSSL